MNPTNTPISYWQPWERLGIGFWEHDKRKKFEKTVQWDPHCPTGLNPLNTYYRSKEDKYGMIELNYAYFEQNATTSWQQEDIESPLLEGGRLRIQYRIAN